MHAIHITPPNQNLPHPMHTINTTPDPQQLCLSFSPATPNRTHTRTRANRQHHTSRTAIRSRHHTTITKPLNTFTPADTSSPHHDTTTTNHPPMQHHVHYPYARHITNPIPPTTPLIRHHICHLFNAFSNDGFGSCARQQNSHFN